MHGMIYKVCSRQSWEEACRIGHYAGSADDVRDGFIHFSTAGQLAETLRRHFSGQDGLVLLTVDPHPLGEALRWEPSRGGALFPHLYGVLPVRQVVHVQPLRLIAGGRHVLPEGLA